MDPRIERDNSDAQCDMPRARLGERVLFVDDERVVREVVQELLRELGYAVVKKSFPQTANVLSVLMVISSCVSEVPCPGFSS